MPCLFHPENHPSFTINSENGLCYCFSCQTGMNFVQFVQTVTDTSYGDALRFLYNNSGQSNTLSRRKVSKADMQQFLATRNISHEAEIMKVEEPETVSAVRNDYLVGRGFSIAEVKAHHMCVVQDKSARFRMYNNWIYIPVYKDGVLRTYFMREPKGDGKIYGYYKEKDEDIGSWKSVGYPRRDIMYNMDNCTDYTAPVAISEGIFDSVYVGRVAKQSVAALSNRILHEHLDFLNKFKVIYLFPDNDATEQGLHLVRSAIKLMFTHQVYVCVLPRHRKDAALSTYAELKDTYANPIPLIDFIVSERYLNFLHKATKKQTKKQR